MTNTLRIDRGLPEIHASEALFQRAARLIPAGTQTLAKGPSQYVQGVCPKYLERGRGARVWDVDGNEYLDMTMAVGPLVLGYAYEPVDRAIREQLERGVTFSLMHPLEVEVAELIHELVPHADAVRFSKTGADVTSAAVRLARAFTGRDRVLCSGYHGWHDWYIGTTARSAGVPSAARELVHATPPGDLGELLDHLDESVACVILEPVIFEQPARVFLPELKKACQRTGALLVFDEMWTGFRLALGGAQQHYDVQADLACFSKAVANGMPLSVLTGRQDVMRLLNDQVFFFTTFGGEALSLAAAQATLHELREQDVCAALARRGRDLKAAYAELTQEKGIGYTRLVGTDPRTLVVFDGDVADPLEQKSLMQQELLRHGVLWAGFNNLSFSHTDSELEYLLEAYGRALDVLDDAVRHGDLRSRLRGNPVQPLFRITR
jgi:glutamate-1-semialdehyde aminotransferase